MVAVLQTLTFDAMHARRESDFNFWPSVADLFLGMFLVAIFLWFAHTLLIAGQRAATVKLPPNDPQTIIQTLEGLRGQYEAARAEQECLNDEIVRLRDEMAEMERLYSDKPPIIRIREDKRFRFDSGSAEISPVFRANLEEKIFPTILDELKRLRGRVDTLEIVGHTDNQPVSHETGNLDGELMRVLHGKAAFSRLRAGSNTDLGLMRTLAIREILKPWLEAHGQNGLQVRCYSAGPSILPDGGLPEFKAAANDAERRRIEIFFLGLKGKTESPKKH